MDNSKYTNKQDISRHFQVYAWRQNET